MRYFDGILWTDKVVPKESPTAGSSTIGRAGQGFGMPGQWSGDSAGVGLPTGARGAAGPGPSGYAAPPTQDYGAGPVGYGQAPNLAWAQLGPTTPDGRLLGEWWQRLLASWLDGLIFGLVSFALAAYWWIPIVQSYVDLLGRLARSSSSADTRAIEAWVEQSSAAMLPIALISLAVHLVSRVFCHSRWGATPGKMALGIRVRRVDRSGPLTVGEAIRREVLSIVTALAGLLPVVGLLGSLVSILDGMWLLWDPRRQTLHDKIGDTLVERKPPQLR